MTHLALIFKAIIKDKLHLIRSRKNKMKKTLKNDEYFTQNKKYFKKVKVIPKLDELAKSLLKPDEYNEFVEKYPCVKDC